MIKLFLNFVRIKHLISLGLIFIALRRLFFVGGCLPYSLLIGDLAASIDLVGEKVI